MSIGAGMLGVERREQEAEERATEEATLELLRKAQVAQEQGDMRLLNEVTQTLDGMLTGTKSRQARGLITQGLSTVSGQRAATQTQQQSNTARSILQTEQALEQFQQQDARRAAGELFEVAPFEERQRRALEERLAQMKQNGAAVTEADTIKYQSELQQLQRTEALREERGKSIIAMLSSVPKDSKEYKSITERANNLNLGKYVTDFEETQLKLEKLDIEVQNLRDEQPGKPLTNEQKERLKATGYTLTGDAVVDRKEFINLVASEAAATRAIALRGITEVSGGEARGQARQALRDIQNEPGADLSLNIFADLNDRIDDLSEEELQELFDLSEGKTPLEIKQISVDWVRGKFKKQFEQMQNVQEVEAQEASEADSAINAVIAATNASSGAKPGDDNYKDPNDPAVRRAALARLESDASKQRAMTQAQEVGGRVL
jgi:hypothetical protein